MLKIPKG